MDGSNGKIIELLERIAGKMDELAEDQKGLREEHRGLREEHRGLREEHRGLREGQQGLREDVQQGFAQVNGRLDNMIKFMGAAHDNHEQRIRALETEVFKKSG